MKRALAAIASLVWLGLACGEDLEEKSLQEQAQRDQQQIEEDQLEPLNRAFFALHELLDGLFLQPMAHAFEDLASPAVQEGWRNVAYNLGEPVTFFNDVLQGEFEKASQALNRFFVNTVMGFGGIIDIAKENQNMPGHVTDFGMTLAKYGVESGPYLFIPLKGPSTFRDGIGIGADFMADPVTWGTRNHHDAAQRNRWVYGKTLFVGVPKRAAALKVTEDAEKTDDSYARYRTLYWQHRQYQLYGIQADQETPTPEENE
jgi:phospholipid-binding lipoprotein MlaA